MGTARCRHGPCSLQVMSTRALLPLLALLAAPALAQRGAPPARRVSLLPAPQANLLRPATPPVTAREDVNGPAGGARPRILVTGYWPPTNEMLRRFSDDPTQNPDGWIGSNWEGRGYDVHAFFPEFPSGLGKGEGDLEVDYQDTSQDWWVITDQIDPIALVTFSRGFTDFSWEVEMNQFNRQTWIPDYEAPTQPTPAPPDASVPAETLRLSTQPVQALVDAIQLANLNLDPYICFSGSGGGFLSEFVAYHGVWYQDLHKDPLDPAWCVAGGHVHVGGLIKKKKATRAAKQTIRTVIHYVDSVLDPSCQLITPYCTTTSNSAGPGALLSTTGSASIASNDLTLIVTDSVPDEFGMFFYGPGQASGSLGDGTLCVAGPLFRVTPARQADADGLVRHTLDLGQAPFGSGPGMVTPGSTWHFQWWLRDPSAGAGSNASSAVSVTFCP